MWLVYALICSIFLSLGTITLKRVLRSVHTLTVANAVAISTGLTSLLILSYKGINTSAENILIIFFTSIISTATSIFTIRIIRHNELTLVSPIFLSSIIITSLLSSLILDEFYSIIQWGGIAIAFFAIVYLEIHELRKGKYSSGALFVLFAGIGLYSLSALIDHAILSKTSTDPFDFILFSNIFIMINMQIYVFNKKIYSETIKFITREWKLVSLICVVTLMSRIFYSFALFLGPVAAVVAVKRSASIVTSIIGGFEFKEHNLKRRILAGLLMFLGIILVGMF